MDEREKKRGPSAGAFDDILAANRSFAERYEAVAASGWAQRGLAVLTCIDTRIEPLSMLGLEPGDAKIIRNAGARVTDDALRSLIIATHALGVERIAVVQHTDCGVHAATQDGLEAKIGEATGQDASGWDYLTFTDQARTLTEDVERIRTCPLLPDVAVRGFIYDVETGELRGD